MTRQEKIEFSKLSLIAFYQREIKDLEYRLKNTSKNAVGVIKTTKAKLNAYKNELKRLQIKPRSIDNLQVGDYAEYVDLDNKLKVLKVRDKYEIHIVKMILTENKNNNKPYQIIPKEWIESWNNND